MKAISLPLLSAIASAAMFTACASEAQSPPSAPPTQAPSETYLDQPQTPGTWTYVKAARETLAVFGAGLDQPVFAIRCANGAIQLGRVATAPPEATRAMKVMAETTSRTLTAKARSGNFPSFVAELESNDPLLDAIAITKGRFVIEVEGENPLYLPAWVEVSRVIEDCR